MVDDRTNSRRRRPIAVDLFSGAGGLALGLEQAGFDVVSAVEHDAVHATTHAFNFPRTHVLCASVAELSPEQLLASVRAGLKQHRRLGDWDGQVDLIAGGPPCQGFSWIGKRRVEDERNDLIFHFWRLVSALRPRYFAMENVPGMASGEHRALLNDLLDRFDADGYKVAPWQILNAADYGVPQSRRRLVVLGSRDDQQPVAHPEPTHRPAAPVKGARNVLHLPPGPTVADALAGLPNLDDFDVLAERDTVRLDSDAVASLADHRSDYARRLSGAQPDPDDLSMPRMYDASLLTASMRTNHTDLSIQRFRATTGGQVEPISRFMRLAPDGLCNTLRAGTGAERGAFTSPRPIHPWYPRVISVREAARLHSLPDWFRPHVTKWNGFRQIGNSVPPLLARAIGKEIVAALDLAPAKPKRRIALGDESLVQLNMREAALRLGEDVKALPGHRDRRRV